MNHELSSGADALESRLHRLAEPTPPTGFAATVLLRTARVEAGRATAAHRAAEAASEKAVRDGTWSTAVFGGAVLALGAAIYPLLTGLTPASFTPSLLRTGPASGIAGGTLAGPAAVLLAIGTLLYLVGLFTSIREERVRPAISPDGTRAGGTPPRP
jgi:hypothetical protein